jgi:hypothetical protein
MEDNNASAREAIDATAPLKELEAEFKRCFDLNDKSGMLEAHRKLIERLSQESSNHEDAPPAEALEFSRVPLEKLRNAEASAFLSACVNVQKGQERSVRNTLSDFEVDSAVLAFKPRTSQPIFESPGELIVEESLPAVYSNRHGSEESLSVHDQSSTRVSALGKDGVGQEDERPTNGGAASSDDTKAIIAAAREQAMRAREEAMALELELAKRRAVHLTELVAQQEEESKDPGVSTGDLFEPIPVVVEVRTEDVRHVLNQEGLDTEDFRPGTKSSPTLGAAGEAEPGTAAAVLSRLKLKSRRVTAQKIEELSPLPTQPVSYYEILGIGRLASNKSVESAFLRKAKALLEHSRKTGLRTSNDLVTLFVARDVILDCLSREDHDYRVLSLKRSAENQTDRSEDDRHAKKMEIAEAITMAGLLEVDEVDLALEMHQPNKNQLFSEFLVENKMLDLDQIESALLGRSLIKDGRLKGNGLKRSFRAAKTFAVDFVDSLLVSVDITPEEILELSRALALNTLTKKIESKISALKPAEKAYVYKPRPIDVSQENTETRLEKLLIFDKPEEGS